MEQSFDRAVDDEVGRPQGGKHRRVTGERLARPGRADRQRPGVDGCRGDHVADPTAERRKRQASGLDADLFRSYIAAFNEPEAYAISHVGWGMNPAARWESLAMWDKTDTNGTELRAFAGNFLFSTGANEVAGRFCRGHFDLPMRNCTVTLDATAVVTDGRLRHDLA